VDSQNRVEKVVLQALAVIRRHTPAVDAEVAFRNTHPIVVGHVAHVTFTFVGRDTIAVRTGIADWDAQIVLFRLDVTFVAGTLVRANTMAI
jgi:hypothetical protein